MIALEYQARESAAELAQHLNVLFGAAGALLAGQLSILFEKGRPLTLVESLGGLFRG